MVEVLEGRLVAGERQVVLGFGGEPALDGFGDREVLEADHAATNGARPKSTVRSRSQRPGSV